MNETTERFFKEIADQIGAHRVEEVYLFPAVKQGITESGVAVIAAIPEEFLSADGVVRHTVYTASYRDTIKGPDRGRWEVDVKAEADAPLITLEKVVQGVVQRSGEPFEPERISGDSFRTIVESFLQEQTADAAE